jgi:hypothetical protein
VSLVLENTLAGDVGVQATNARLAASATLGTVTLSSGGARAVYDDTYTVHGLPMLRVASGFHRGDTPRLLAGTVGATWALRVYMVLPGLQASGNGTNEVRWTLDVGTGSGRTGLILSETTAGNINTRLQSWDLAAAAITATGTGAVALAQIVRLEARCNGTDTTLRLYPGHSTDPATRREVTFAGQAWTGPLSLTGYRYRIRPTLYWGNQGTAVRDLQNELIDLGYNLGAAGADGDFGNATYTAVVSFQQTRGLSPADGIPGPETRAAMDLARGIVPPPLRLARLAVSTGEWIGPAAPPPAPTAPRRLRLGLPI